MFLTSVFAYLGPETALPLTSVIATIVGLVVLLGKTGWMVVARIVRRPLILLRKNQSIRRPHVPGFRTQMRSAPAPGGRNET